MIVFKKVRFKNLLSFGNMMTEVILDKAPTTLIQGKNGGGKSSVLDAICFALFGKPFRKINKPHLINHKNKKDLMTEIEFRVNESDYMIRRGMNPQIFEIYKDGVMLDQSAAVKDYQVYLEKYILRFDFQTFTQLVILGKATYVSFMRLLAADRRKFIENILGLSIFSVMNEVHKLKVNDLKDALAEMNSDIKILKEKIIVRKKYIQDLVEDAKHQRDEALRKITEEIEKIKGEITDLESQQLELMATQEDIDEKQRDVLQDKLEKLFDFRSKFNMKLNQYENDAKFFETNSTCPTCSQDITEDVRIAKSEVLNMRKAEAGLMIEKVKADIETVNKTLEEVNEVISHNMTISKEFNAIQTTINSLHKRINDLEQSKDHEVPNKDKIDTETAALADLTTGYDDFLNKKAEMVDKAEYFELISGMLKDTGIKSMVIRKYIPIINSTINHYLKHLGFFVKFVLDENFEERIYSRGIDELSYYNFSEGEKLRIDLAVLMAWRDVAKVQNNTCTNLLIFDEILDASIDQGGADAFIELLQGMKQTNVFVVSHSADRWADKFRGGMVFGKEGGFSKLLTA